MQGYFFLQIFRQLLYQGFHWFKQHREYKILRQHFLGNHNIQPMQYTGFGFFHNDHLWSPLNHSKSTSGGLRAEGPPITWTNVNMHIFNEENLKRTEIEIGRNVYHRHKDTYQKISLKIYPIPENTRRFGFGSC